MSLFGFADIKFNKGSPVRRGPLAPLVGSQFERTTLRYPIDVGNADKGHYVVFYIREQKTSSFTSRSVEGGLDKVPTLEKPLNAGSAATPQKLASAFGNELLGKINSGLNQINQQTNGALSGLTSKIGNAAGSVVGGISNIFGQSNVNLGGSSAQSDEVINNSIKQITGGSLGFLRTTRLTKDAIAMYMPDTLLYSYSQSYDQLSLGGEAGGQILAAGKSAFDAFKEGGIGSAAGAVAKTGVETAKQLGIGGALGALGSAQTGQALIAATGRVQNPMLEMVYKSPNFRTFQFDFIFYPRDEREALEVQRILERFRFHQAPELLKNAGGFLVPPSEFDIKFYYAGAENSNIPQIATCVLTTIDIDYAPNGFAAYEVPGENSPNLGRTGMPVSIKMTLQFQEMTYLTKQDFTSDSEFETRKNNAASQRGEFGPS